MNKKVLIIGIIVLFTAAGFAQQKFTVAPYAGYAMSAFEDQESAAGSILAGVNLGYNVMPALQVGAEFSYVIGGFGFETEFLGETITTTFNMMMLGGYGKYFIGTGNIKPFVKAGVGYYMGNAKVEGGGEEEDVDVDSNIGFNFGGGAVMNNGVFLEFNFNMVSREDVGMNYWAVFVGYQLIK
jgi:hypothetical protein